mmetsp:Transcript_6101/g.10847  ORF Transcript_6101/g.10847 Transcript_6101/m.10847 type:complete len:550 (+) Transcript_6101:172-1821(+)
MPTSAFQARLAKWESSSVPLTPEAQERKIREERERQKGAVKLARARATRYNMTLRAMSLKSVKEQADQKKKDMQALREAKDRAKKFNMTSRALELVTVRNQRNVSRALDSSVNPAIAKEVLEAAAFYQANSESSVTNPSLSEKKRLANAVRLVESSMVEVPSSDIESDSEEDDEEVEPEEEDEEQAQKDDSANEDEDEDEDEDEAPKGEKEDEAEADSLDEDGVIVMEELAIAVAEGDEDGVNRAILKEFLEEHAPERVGEVDDLLEQYQGSNIDVLFQELVSTYPDPGQAAAEGEQSALAKAMKEAAESMAAETDFNFDDELDVPESEPEKEPEQEPEQEPEPEPEPESPKEKEAEKEAEVDAEEDVSPAQKVKAEAQTAEEREQAKIAAMSEDEKMDYFKEKADEKARIEKKDEMLKNQLDLYKKNTNTKTSAVKAMTEAVTPISSVAKRLSKRLSKRVSKRAGRKSVAKVLGKTGKAKGKKSIVGEGFILSAKIDPRKSKDRDSVNMSSSKWAVNVQPQLLRERMKKAGVADKDIDVLMSEESDML